MLASGCGVRGVGFRDEARCSSSKMDSREGGRDLNRTGRSAGSEGIVASGIHGVDLSATLPPAPFCAELRLQSEGDGGAERSKGPGCTISFARSGNGNGGFECALSVFG